MKLKIINNREGIILPLVIVFGAIAMLILGGIVNWGLLNIKAARQAVKRETAFQIAESGNEYYRWHLAHSPTDYQDGTGIAGPYVHQFYDKSGYQIGQFTLDITAPPVGSSIVTVKSSGKVLSDFSGSRTIVTRLAKPSLAKFSVAANANMRFGEGTVIDGPVHSNGGIRFDGVANNIVTSALDKYDDLDHSDTNKEFGVHTHVNAPPGSGINDDYRPLEAPPNTPAARADVFKTGRQFPVPAIDFSGFTADISTMRTDAIANGFHRAGSGALGYHVVLRTDDTFNFYQVTSLAAPPSGCTNSTAGWGSWSIGAETLLGNYPFPANGLIFLEDNVFVDGQINTARLTIVAAVFPDDVTSRKSITVNNNLLYTNKDGQDVISLIAQNNFNVGLYSQDILEIDAALIAQNGRAGRYYYPPAYTDSHHNYYANCDPDDTKNTLTLYGMIASNLRYGFAYTDNTGYQTRIIKYDSNLLYSPPPSFPQTSEQYSILSWEEIK
jgi:hypothetical protein